MNGEVADPRDFDAVCAAIERTMRKRAEGGPSREAIQATVNHGSLEQYADAFEHAIEMVLAAPSESQAGNR